MANMCTHVIWDHINIVRVSLDVRFVQMVLTIPGTRLLDHQIPVMSVKKTMFVFKVTNDHVVLVHIPIVRRKNVFHVMVIQKIQTLASKANRLL